MIKTRSNNLQTNSVLCCEISFEVIVLSFVDLLFIVTLKISDVTSKLIRSLVCYSKKDIKAIKNFLFKIWTRCKHASVKGTVYKVD